MPTDSLPPDERPASPPLPQSWCSVVENLGATGALDEPVDEPAPKRAPPAVVDLGWKAPSVPVFERDAAPENTIPAAAPRVPTKNDETVRMLREHIVPDPMPPDVDDDAAALNELEMHLLRAHIASAPTPPDDPDFQEVRREPTIALTADFLVDVNTPPKGAEAAQAPVSPPCGRDDATPNDGAVPQVSLSAHFDPATVAEMFRCAFWSNGTLELRTSDGERFVLNEDDTRSLLRYVGEALSARARAAA